MTLFISLKSSLLNNVIIHSKLKKILHLESHKNIIFSILSTIYQHFLSVETKIFCFIKYLENAKNFCYINFIHFFVSIVLKIFLQRVLFLYQVLYIERLLCLIHCTYLNNKRNKLNKDIKHSFIPPHGTCVSLSSLFISTFIDP